jgi:hypothetical protein
MRLTKKIAVFEMNVQKMKTQKDNIKKKPNNRFI